MRKDEVIELMLTMAEKLEKAVTHHSKLILSETFTRNPVAQIAPILEKLPSIVGFLQTHYPNMVASIKTWDDKLNPCSKQYDANLPVDVITAKQDYRRFNYCCQQLALALKERAMELKTSKKSKGEHFDIALMQQTTHLLGNIEKVAGSLKNVASLGKNREDETKSAHKLGPVQISKKTEGQSLNGKHIKEPSPKAIQAYLLRISLGWKQEKCAEIMTAEYKPEVPFKQWQISRWEKECREWLKHYNFDVFPTHMTTNIILLPPDKLGIGARTDGKITGDPHHMKKKIPDPNGDIYD